MKTLENTIRKSLEFNLQDYSYTTLERTVTDVQEQGVKRKISQQAMLESLFNPDTGECHEHSTELMDMILEEYQVSMMERSSGNGHAHNVFNDDTGEYDFYLSADGTQGRSTKHNDLSQALYDGYDGDIINKNQKDICAFTVINDDDSMVRIDDLDELITVDDSDYSLWDKIEECGQLIVRHSGHWQGKGGQFIKTDYAAREKARMLRKHRKLLGLTATAKGNNWSLKLEEEKRIRVIQKGKRVSLQQKAKWVRDARKGMQYAKDELAKIGYNQF